jgi:hypothetical protein
MRRNKSGRGPSCASALAGAKVGRPVTFREIPGTSGPEGPKPDSKPKRDCLTATFTRVQCRLDNHRPS